MSEQISAIQTREVLELMRNLAPILNQKELFEFMLFSNRVVERYIPEHYNDGMSEEVTEMRKDKEWLRDEVSELYPSYDEVDYETVAKVQIIDEVLELIDQLDEFELTQEQVDKYLHERNLVAMDAMMIHETGMQNKVIIERPVIPQFGADYIEKWKYERLIMHEWFMFDHDDEDEDKLSKWLYNNDDETNKRREFMLIDAIRYGYEVEKEKLYHVVNKENYFMLRKYDGLVDILHVSPSMSRDEYGKDTRFMLTEQEIKEYDERFWAFAQEVVE